MATRGRSFGTVERSVQKAITTLHRVTYELSGGIAAAEVPAGAEVMSPEERAHWWPIRVQRHKGYAGYQANTGRDIPVVNGGNLAGHCDGLEPVRRGTVLKPQPPLGSSRRYVVATVTQVGRGRGVCCGVDVLCWTGSRLGWQRARGESEFVTSGGVEDLSRDYCSR